MTKVVLSVLSQGDEQPRHGTTLGDRGNEDGCD